MRRILQRLLAISLATMAGTAWGLPVKWEANGHYYEAVSVPGGISWTAASAAATVRGGHLATVTSGAENAFIWGLIDNPLYWNQEPGGSNLGPWIGGFQTSDNGSTPNANWTWVTGEPFTYTNWYTGEPNNFTGAQENYLSYKCWGTSDCRSAQWNDLPDAISEFGTSVRAYVVEIDTPSAVGALPSPSAMLRPACPNPFNPRTTLSFDLPAPARVSLSVCDVRGAVVRRLLDGTMTAGSHDLVWDGLDDSGRGVASGGYFARLVADGVVQTVPMALLR